MRQTEPYHLAMFIDDNETDILIATEMAKRAWFADHYITCTSANSALTYLEKHVNQPDQLPDMIFLDINMPVVSGFAFLAEFEAFPQAVKEKCKIVMLSSSIDYKDVRKAINNPYVIKFINKPLRAAHLYELKRKVGEEADVHRKEH